MTNIEVDILYQQAKRHYKDFNMQLKWMRAVIYLSGKGKK